MPAYNRTYSFLNFKLIEYNEIRRLYNIEINEHSLLRVPNKFCRSLRFVQVLEFKRICIFLHNTKNVLRGFERYFTRSKTLLKISQMNILKRK